MILPARSAPIQSGVMPPHSRPPSRLFGVRRQVCALDSRGTRV